MLAIGAIIGACAASQAAERSSARATPTATVTRTATLLPPTATATATTLPPTPTATATATAEPTDPPPPTEPPVSDVQAIAQPPAPVAPVRGGTQLALPANTTVIHGGCASDGECHWYNFYWAPTHEIVIQPGEGQSKVQHELCHAHQHWSINGGAPLAPSDYDLESWYGTPEGGSFTAAVAGLAWPWTHSAANGLEDFAWTCAYWYLDPAYLLSLSPDRYRWAESNLP